MARFPRTEAEVVALAEAVISGLADNAAVYPAPPVLPADLTALISAYTVVKNDSIAPPRPQQNRQRLIRTMPWKIWSMQ